MDIDKLIQELLSQPSSEGYSARELSEKYGFSIDRARKLIRKWIEEGKMVPAKKPRKNMAGIVAEQIVYCLVKDSSEVEAEVMLKQ